jgi:hypothetical protein
VLTVRALDGVKVAVDPANVTTPATATGGVPAVKVKVVVLIVAGFIASLKVAVTAVLGQMPTARFRGVTEITVGGAHASLEVVKVHTKLLASAMPYASMAPVVIVAV